jgi:hypothetical protein
VDRIPLDLMPWIELSDGGLCPTGSSYRKPLVEALLRPDALDFLLKVAE